jgi:hypothetical protein
MGLVTATDVITTLNQFTALGLDNQITELDVSIYSGSFQGAFTAYEDIPADRFVRQAFKYRDLFRSFRYLAGHISSVTLWGQADDHTWLTSSARVNAPLLFDPGLTHKLAYTAIMSPSDLPDAGSTVSFSGAYIVRPDGPSGRRTANATLDLSNNGPSGTARFNFNNPSTQVRFTSTDVITYDLTPAGAGSRVDFTVVGTSGDDEGVILTGYAIDGGPAGSGADSVSVTVRTSTGTVLFTGTGTVSEGDVVIVR